jgi:sortase (surface protein transpeptidase)
VERHYIVRSDEVSVLQDHGREILRLQACHPRFFATHRYIVDATLTSITPTDGQTYIVKAAAN